MVNVQGFTCAVHGNNDGQSHRCFGRRYHHHEEHEYLAAERMPLSGKSDE